MVGLSDLFGWFFSVLKWFLASYGLVEDSSLQLRVPAGTVFRDQRWRWTIGAYVTNPIYQ